MAQLKACDSKDHCVYSLDFLSRRAGGSSFTLSTAYMPQRQASTLRAGVDKKRKRGVSPLKPLNNNNSEQMNGIDSQLIYHICIIVQLVMVSLPSLWRIINPPQVFIILTPYSSTS